MVFSFHLKTNKYSVHKALDNYYNSIIPLVDSFVEAYQGKYSRITGYKNIPFSENDNNVVKYFKNLLVKINKFKVKDSYLQNIIDSIYQLIYSTLYQLSLK